MSATQTRNNEKQRIERNEQEDIKRVILNENNEVAFIATRSKMKKPGHYNDGNCQTKQFEIFRKHTILSSFHISLLRSWASIHICNHFLIVCLSTYQSVWLPVNRCLSAYVLPIYTPRYLPIFWYFCLTICKYAYLPTYLSLFYLNLF